MRGLTEQERAVLQTPRGGIHTADQSNLIPGLVARGLMIVDTAIPNGFDPNITWYQTTPLAEIVLQYDAMTRKEIIL